MAERIGLFSLRESAGKRIESKKWWNKYYILYSNRAQQIFKNANIIVVGFSFLVNYIVFPYFLKIKKIYVRVFRREAEKKITRKYVST